MGLANSTCDFQCLPNGAIIHFEDNPSRYDDGGVRHDQQRAEP
jgi:hypothetical protein